MKQYLKKAAGVLLSVALLVTCLPLGALVSFAAEEGQLVADHQTLDGWKDLFNENSSEYAGRIWLDKSVLTSASDLQAAGVTKDADDSFLVALSAMGSSIGVTGTSSAPTDTIFVLDISGSMDDFTGRDEKMVEAANIAIGKLFEQNPNNRVGVVLYSSSGSVLLPLDRYTTTSYTGYGTSRVPSYIYLSFSDEVSIARGVRNSAGNAPSSRAYEVVGGTYIQEGLYAALEQLTADGHSTTVEIGGHELNRTPVLVLMSDGEPTYATNRYNDVGDSNIGSGSDSTSDIAFLTQLTASYVKEKAGEFYGAEALMFTLGLGVEGNELAMSVMDPMSDDAHKDTAEYWKAFAAADEGAEIRLNNSYYFSLTGGFRYRYVTKLNDGVNDGTDNLPLSRDYVDAYISSENASDLYDAFEDIVSKIELRTRRYPTLIREDDNHSGFVTFVDKLGAYMTVTDIKGVLINNTLFSGADLSSNFVAGGGSLGTFTDPTELGHSFVAAVQTRLGIESADAARTLIGLAYDAGQLSYNTETGEYSNYIGWQADADGNYLGFWEEGIDTLHPDAVYAVRSYGYLGEVNEEQGVSKSDMMYMTVQVRTDLATGEELVTFAVPAALLPILAYNVTLDELGNPTELTTTGAKQPIRLVYEVALREEINQYTLSDFVSAEYLAENTDANGKVSFYSNLFEKNGATGYGLDNTYGYFNPDKSNDRYYFTEDALIYEDTAGTVYTGEARPSGSMYRAILTYVKDGSGVRETLSYKPVSAESLAIAEKRADGWYVPAGSVDADTSDLVVTKRENATETLSGVRIPVVDTRGHAADDSGYHFFVGATLGNNGRLRLQADTGIKIKKEMAEGEAIPAEAFAFTLKNVTDPTDNGLYDALLVEADGTQSATEVSFTNGVAEVALAAGQTLYVGGMTDGDLIEVTETETADYLLVGVNGKEIKSARLSVTEGEMASAVFTNATRGKGDFAVTKEIKHSLGNGYVIPDSLNFKMTVTLKGIGTANATFEAKKTGGSLTSVTTDDNGSFSIALKNGETLTVYDLPEGTEVSVVEDTVLDGFAPSYFDNGEAGDGVVSVRADNVSSVIVLNGYEPKQVFPVNLEVGGTKYFVNEDQSAADWGNNQFSLQLQKQVGNEWKPLETVVVSASNQTFAFDLSEEIFDEAITYSYRIVELEPAAEDRADGVFYDNTIHYFNVEVSDKEMDGRLEIVRVYSDYSDTDYVLTDGTYTVTVDFTNTQHITSPALASIDIQKELINRAESPLVTEAGYEFALYTDADCTVPVTEAVEGVVSVSYTKTDAIGLGGADVIFDEAGSYTFYLKEIAGDNAHMTYSSEVVTLNITVTASGSALLAEVEYSVPLNEAGAVEFSNVYIPDSASLVVDFVEKELLGRDVAEGESFAFLLASVDGAITIPGASGADADGDGYLDVTFESALTFDKVGVYFFNITETSESANGITADETVYRLTVTVTDVDGQLTASYLLENAAADEVVFVNRYEATSTENSLKADKTLTGRTLANGEFTFSAQASLRDGSVISTAPVLTAKNAADGSITFPSITYTEAGVYYYLIDEVQDAGANSYGIAYDQTQFIAEVTVTDDGLGALSVTEVSYRVKGGEAVDSASFVNRYVAEPTTATIGGRKDFDGKLLVGEDFSFTLYLSDENGNRIELLETVQNDVEGRFSFAELEYDTAGSYYYLVVEENGGATIDGVTYDTEQYLVRVDVTDDLVGALHADASIFDKRGTPQQMVLFYNLYAVTGEAEVTLSGNKTLNGREMEDGEFIFHLFETDAEFNTEGASPLDWTVNENGAFSFDLTYLPEDVGNTYYYVVKEEFSGTTVEGVTYDSTEYYVAVVVSDNGVGGIDAVASVVNLPAAINALNFENSYAAAATDFELGGTKYLDGRELLANEFTFVLQETDANLGILDGGYTASVTNAADGSFSFEAIPLTAEGTFYFLLSESTESEADRITFDDARYFITVEVTDNGLGALVAGTPLVEKLDAEGTDGILFENVYTPKPQDIVLPLEILKDVVNLGSEELGAEGFVFVLEDAEGNRLLATSDELGNALFELVFTEDDIGSVYTYTLFEADGEQQYVTYDERVYALEISIELGDDNALIATLLVDGEPVEESLFLFVNEYDYTPEPSPKPDGPAPVTGDGSSNVMLVALLFVGCGGVLVATKSRKKDEEEA